jgi:hypothetical protein
MLKYIGLIDLAFTLYAFVECAMRDESAIKRLPKWAWLLIILFAQSLGAIGYFALGRVGPFKGKGPSQKRPKPRILPPDDDPDFLKKI